MDREALADFLRRRRESLAPTQAGHRNRRTKGLRREEVAELAHISTDYYTRLEQRRGSRPSPEVTSSLARGLALTDDERDHLYVLAGHHPPGRAPSTDQPDSALRTAMQALTENPALVLSGLGATLAQNKLATALFGDQTRYAGWERSGYYRWFVLREEREIYPADIHADQSRLYAASVRAAADLRADAVELAAVLRDRSPEFAELWSRHDVQACLRETTSVLHPAVGRLDFTSELIYDNTRQQKLLILTPRPGDDAKLRTLHRDHRTGPASDPGGDRQGPRRRHRR